MDEEVIPILRVANAATAVGWYERLGFAKKWEHRFEPGMPAFVRQAGLDVCPVQRHPAPCMHSRGDHRQEVLWLQRRYHSPEAGILRA
jgi:hypothetical protein